jgi:hypothetical protein
MVLIYVYINYIVFIYHIILSTELFMENCFYNNFLYSYYSIFLQLFNLVFKNIDIILL